MGLRLTPGPSPYRAWRGESILATTVASADASLPLSVLPQVGERGPGVRLAAPISLPAHRGVVGEDKGEYGAGARRTAGGGAGAERRPGRGHVIHQDHSAASDL